MEKCSFGYIAIVSEITYKWDYFKYLPIELKVVYGLTKEGYELYDDWLCNGKYEDMNDMAMWDMLTHDDKLSKRII